MPRASRSALKTDKIPRPRNAFLIFRKVNIELIRSNIGKSHPVQMEISREAGRLWNGASPAVRGEYKRLAEIEKQEHALKYPGYVYRPRTAAEIAQDKAEKARSKGKTSRRMTAASRYGEHVVNDLEVTSSEGSPRSLFSPYPTSDTDSYGSQPSSYHSADSWGSSPDSGNQEISPYSNHWVLDPNYQASLVPSSRTSRGSTNDLLLQQTSALPTQMSQEQQSTMYSPFLSQADFLAAFDSLVAEQALAPAASVLNVAEHTSTVSLSNPFEVDANYSMSFGVPSTNNVDTGLNVASFSGDNFYHSTDLLPELDPSLVPWNYFERQEPYQSQQSIDPQLEYYRLPSYNN